LCGHEEEEGELEEEKKRKVGCPDTLMWLARPLWEVI
jgi:hypothetical protein